MRGEAEAREHARQTGHQSFQVGESKSAGGAWLMSNHRSAAESATAACAPVLIDGQTQCDVCRSTADDAALDYPPPVRNVPLVPLRPLSWRTVRSIVRQASSGVLRTAEGCSRRSLVSCTQRRRRVRNLSWLTSVYFSALGQSLNVRNIAHVPRPRRHIASIATCLTRIVRRQGSL